MSPNTLLTLRKSLESNLKINKKRLEKLLEIMGSWTKGKIIYPNLLKSQLFTSFSDVYDILNFLEKEKILAYAFQIYCHQCNEFQEKKIMDSLNEFPEDAYCDENHKLDPFKDVILLYKVIVDE